MAGQLLVISIYIARVVTQYEFIYFTISDIILFCILNCRKVDLTKLICKE